MKKLCIISLILLTITSFKHADDKFELSGKIIGDTTGIVVLTQIGQSRFDADTSLIVDGKFHISGYREYPEYFSLMTEKPNQRIFRPIRIFISPGDKIEIELNTENIEKSAMKGSLINDEFQKYLTIVERYGDDQLDILEAAYKKVAEINDTLRMKEIEIQRNFLYKELEKIRTQKAYEYIKTNPKSFVSAYSMYNYRQTFDIEQINELISLLDEKLFHSKYIFNIVHAERNQPGTKASDFTLKDTQDREIVFSKFSKGKVILLDFWASWCGPCRVANPELEKVYKQYKDKGFEILGISQDRDLQTLQKSIETDQITWINLLDEKGNKAVKELYNVSSLPANVLIDKNGTIIARNVGLSHLNELEKLLK
jgi:thiol-disulfide isomerase/thioredoxin